MPSALCLKCSIQMRSALIGVVVIETASLGGEVVPYKVWAADLLECPECHCQVVGGFSQKPIREDDRSEDFKSWLDAVIENLNKLPFQKYQRLYFMNEWPPPEG